eukprot:2067210-Rhodomonas_salina.3
MPPKKGSKAAKKAEEAARRAEEERLAALVEQVRFTVVCPLPAETVAEGVARRSVWSGSAWIVRKRNGASLKRNEWYCDNRA